MIASQFVVDLPGEVLPAVDGDVAAALLAAGDVRAAAPHRYDLGPVELDGRHRHVRRPLRGQLCKSDN